MYNWIHSLPLYAKTNLKWVRDLSKCKSYEYMEYKYKWDSQKFLYNQHVEKFKPSGKRLINYIEILNLHFT